MACLAVPALLAVPTAGCCAAASKQIAESRKLLTASAGRPAVRASVGKTARETRRRGLRRSAVASAEASVVDGGAAAAKDQKTTYHFVVANAKFMLDEEEHFQEVLRERLRHFKEMNREQDFWLLFEPSFLEEFPDITSRLSRPAVALMSTDAQWITFMKLRLDRVLKGSFEAATFTEAAESKPFDISFDKPQEWRAPYQKYEEGWWTPFIPPEVQK
jgi:hypothetical protein